ncbi:MAG: RNA methyltransferase [Chryseolinea sp.]
MLTPKEQLVSEHLSKFVSDHKKSGVERVLENRTRHITVVLEDIFQSQNASAVVRTCECMGIQDIHILENISKYSINPKVLKGANKWMNLHVHASSDHDNTITCLNNLKKLGYKVLVADPDPDGLSIFDFDITKSKVALLFGNELRGVSKSALENCDHKVRIPMYGFTESLNISVSVAICVNSLINKLHLSGIPLGLNDEEKAIIRLGWYRKIVKKSSLIEREFLRAIE